MLSLMETVHHFEVTTRTGDMAWTAVQLQQWIETLSGQTVEVIPMAQKRWWGLQKTLNFRVTLKASAEEAQRFLGVLQSQLKVKRLHGESP